MPALSDISIMLVGERVGAVPCPETHEARRVRLSEWPPRGARRALVVLGDEAICRLEPGDLDRQEGGDRLVLICPSETPSLRRAEVWVEAGYRLFVGRDALPGRVERAVADVAAGRDGAGIDPGDWAPRPLVAGSLADRACRKLVHLPCSWYVQGWAEALGWSTKKLRVVCRDAFGLNPKEVLRYRVRHQLREGRRIGLPWHCLARICGYHDCSNLLRGLKGRERYRTGAPPRWRAGGGEDRPSRA